MASGDTKTNQYLDIAANGTRADLPTDTCCETRTQSLIRGVAERVISVEEEVERLENNPDVVDIVATYQDLQNYDTSGLTDKDIIRVLEDSTHNNNSTYYRWNAATNQFDFVGEISGGSSVNVVQATGTSNTDVMSQSAVSSVLFDDPAGRTRVKIGERAAANGSQSVAIGHWARTGNPSCVAIGGSNDVTSAAAAIGNGATAVGSGARIEGGAGGLVGNFGTVVGYNASVAGARCGVAIGAYSKATENGQFDISTLATTNTWGYNNSQYRLLTGLYDPQNAHDAATKGYVDGLVGDIEAALNVINNGTGA